MYPFMNLVLASIAAENEKMVTFLTHNEQIRGKSFVAPGIDRFIVTLPFLIQLLAADPDGLEPVAAAVEIIPRPGEDIERELRGETPE